MKRALLFIAVLAFAAAAYAQDSGPSVTALTPDPVRVIAGKSAPVTLNFRVNNGFHINSNKPNSEILIPTELKLDPPSQLMVADVTYPPGEMLSIPIVNEKISVYSGDFQIGARVLAVRAISPGTYRVRGMLRFQACNDRQCFPPRTTPIHFDVHIVRARRR